MIDMITRKTLKYMGRDIQTSARKNFDGNAIVQQILDDPDQFRNWNNVLSQLEDLYSELRDVWMAADKNFAHMPTSASQSDINAKLKQIMDLATEFSTLSIVVEKALYQYDEIVEQESQLG